MKMTQRQKDELLQFMNNGQFTMVGKDIIHHTILIQEIASCEIEEPKEKK